MNATPSIFIFLVDFFSVPSNMNLVHLFCFTTFFKFMFSKKFFFAKMTSFFESDKIVILKSMSHLQFITFSITSSSSTPTNLPLAHLFCLRRFFLSLVKKKIVIAFFVIFNGLVGDHKTLFWIFFLSKTVYFYLIFLLHASPLRLIH